MSPLITFSSCVVLKFFRSMNLYQPPSHEGIKRKKFYSTILSLLVLKITRLSSMFINFVGKEFHDTKG